MLMWFLTGSTGLENGKHMSGSAQMAQIALSFGGHRLPEKLQPEPVLTIIV